MTIDDALEKWIVENCDEVNDAMRNDPPILPGWFGVSNNDGIIAYFNTEAAAFRHRLAEINRELNP